jgi:hypothetical protein
MSGGVDNAVSDSREGDQPSTAAGAEITFRYSQQLGGGSFVKALQGIDSLILH